jgi:GTPase SAR1 family protein
MEPINIAIIGAKGVGKSTFIQHLRRAPRPSASNITSLRQELDGAPYIVTLVELDLEGIELDPNQPVQWPKQIGGHMMPRMDGALIMYDAVNEETTREVPPIMGESLSRINPDSDAY